MSMMTETTQKKSQVPVRHLVPGDVIVGRSDARVVAVYADSKTRKGYRHVILDRNGHQSLAEWNASTRVIVLT